MIRKKLTCRLEDPQAFPLPTDFRYNFSDWQEVTASVTDAGSNTIPVLKVKGVEK